LNLFGWLRRRRPRPQPVIRVPPPDVDPIEELTRILDETAGESSAGACRLDLLSPQ